jgi:hypothetical protein
VSNHRNNITIIIIVYYLIIDLKNNASFTDQMKEQCKIKVYNYLNYIDIGLYAKDYIKNKFINL